MKHCPNDSCAFRKSHRFASEYEDRVEECAECKTWLADGPSPELESNSSGQSELDLLANKRILVSVGLFAAFMAGNYVLLPSITPTDFAWFRPTAKDLPNMSVLALGIAPFLSSSIFVEYGALIVPKWRGLRETVDGRQRLFRVSFYLCLAFAFLQGFGIAMLLEGLGAPAGWGFRFMTMLTLTAGTAVSMNLASAIHKWGAGHGVSVFIAGGILVSAGYALRAAIVDLQAGSLGAFQLIGGLVSCLVPIFATWKLSHIQVSKEPEAPTILLLPVCGLAPSIFAYTLLSYPLMLGISFLPVEGTPTYRILVFLVSVPLAVVFTRLFHLPENLRREGAEPISKAVLAKAVSLSIAYLGLLEFCSYLAALALPSHCRIPTLELAALTAIAIDLLRELKARKYSHVSESVWLTHKVYAAKLACLALQEQEIPFLARGLVHRTMLQFFGPYIPVEILVAPADLSRADECLKKIACELNLSNPKRNGTSAGCPLPTTAATRVSPP